MDTRPVSSSSERPIKTSLSRNSPEQEVAKVLKSIFKCSICLNTVCLPAAACASCYAVMGYIPCVEQWYASSAEPHQVPLLITLSDGCYAEFPVIILPPISCMLAGVRLAVIDSDFHRGDETILNFATVC